MGYPSPFPIGTYLPTLRKLGMGTFSRSRLSQPAPGSDIVSLTAIVGHVKYLTLRWSH